MNQIQQRQQALTPLSRTEPWDMLIIGGGITGAGIAREAAKRGLQVLLIEQKDFAWGTSSRSSKMVHGGLRYIASGDYKTTVLSVRERERMLNEAEGLVNEMHYMMPHYKGKFPPPWMFNTLLKVYDKLAGKRYLKAESLIKNDQGLVVGAIVVDTATPQPSKTYQIYAKVVVSATGAWADNLRLQATDKTEASFHKQIRPSRGSHLVVSQQRLPIEQAYTLLHPVDKRALFIFPWENRTVIGTTDLDHPPLDDTEVGITNDEVDYLLQAVNGLFDHAELGREDIISTWAGVRPLISESEDGKRVSPSKEKRDHSVWIDNNLVTVSGGKLTTFRLIALDVLKTCAKVLPISELTAADEAVFSNPLPNNEKFAQLPEPLQKRLRGFYGRQLDQLLELAEAQDLVPVANSNTLWAEVRFAAHYEQVMHLDDLLLRRTRLGLVLPEGAIIPEVVGKLKQIGQQELGWDEARWTEELQRYQQLWQRYYHLPAA